MFSCEFCEIFQNSFITEHLQATGSVDTTKIQTQIHKHRPRHIFVKHEVITDIIVPKRIQNPVKYLRWTAA